MKYMTLNGSFTMLTEVMQQCAVMEAEQQRIMHINTNFLQRVCVFLTGAGVIEAEVDGDIVTSELTPPKIINQDIEEFGKKWWLIDTGVPHLVGLVDTVDTFDLQEARELRYKFNANVNIAAVKDNTLSVRTYERGVEDETLACGTGMAACFYRANLENKAGESMLVIPTSGEKLELAKKGNTLTLKGEVRHIFDAIMEIEVD